MTPSPEDLSQSLAIAANEHREAEERTEHLRQIRNELVREALAAGKTHAWIAAATGLSRGRISQIKEQP